MKSLTKQQKGIDYWTKRVSSREIPALCSTVKDLEKLAKDDVSSLAKLGRSVMHDNALTSRILRVANSAIYNKGNSKVSTVSRAAVVLGFDSIRNICITAKMLSSLLASKNLSQSVYQRLLKLMAQSFQAAMLARMMLSDHDDGLKEEAFIASLLYRIGEVAFWSVGDAHSDKLDKLLDEVDETAVYATIKSELGISFNQLSQGVARSWGLGELLVKSLTTPSERTPEIRSIYLADQLAELVSGDNIDKDKLSLFIAQAAENLDISTESFTAKFIECNKQTQKLAEAYGANEMLAFIPDAKDAIDRISHNEHPLSTHNPPNLTLQLTKIRQLTNTIVNKTDFNEVMKVALEGMLKGVGVDRCGVLLLSRDHLFLQPRVVLGEGKEALKQQLHIRLDNPSSAFTQCVRVKQPMNINVSNIESVLNHVGDNVAEQLSTYGFMIAPLVVDNKILGIFYADRYFAKQEFDLVDFESFCHLAQLANLGFTTSMH
ncbi:HDOD domain-containing protein [Shewanella intestini]|uniref:HDOD domain-containing protein n=1 Tax=Shewanella intestini TaxID=2017544 RepID=A0ABS5I2K9_9GAMM|nr:MULTISPECIES: HDOD domain-containing protein [Shewanella]MBR9728263.1 HDOD domain-containing protein [Shewanella intestini]MRG35728.1 HDOD domain-containing protein [Shewanella sp. XMDDZSB0408]